MKDSCAYAKPMECLRALVPDRVVDRVAGFLQSDPALHPLNSLSIDRVD
jgi:hypothetical protein